MTLSAEGKLEKGEGDRRRARGFSHIGTEALPWHTRTMSVHGHRIVIFCEK